MKIDPAKAAKEIAANALQNAMDEWGSLGEALDAYVPESREWSEAAFDAYLEEVVGQLDKIRRRMQ